MHYQKLQSLAPTPSKNHTSAEMEVDKPISSKGSRNDDDDDDDDDDNAVKVEYKLYRQMQRGLWGKSEIDRYLKDEVEDDRKGFDILGWWRVKSSKYRVLFQVAKDVLAIPVSTVALESAFSTEGRVLDQFRSSLTPKIVECLISAQDWLRASPLPVEVEEKLEDLQEIETSSNNS